MIVDLLFWAFSALAVLAGWRVFRSDSMVRAAFFLLVSFLAVAAILVLLQATFLGLVLMLMMAGEMTIMAVFMVMFMMNPAGLNPMQMVHQHKLAIAAGATTFVGLAAVALLAPFPAATADGARATAELGTELLGSSMLVFETAGITLLATMVGSIAIASSKGRYGPAGPGSEPPGGAEPVEESDGGHGGHEGHDGHEGSEGEGREGEGAEGGDGEGGGDHGQKHGGHHEH